MRLILDEDEPGEAARKAGALLKALAADLAPASPEAAAALAALEEADLDARAPRPMRDPALEALRKAVGNVVAEELRALEGALAELAETPDVEKAAGPFVGPRGGLWADAQHTQHWDPHAIVKIHGVVDTREYEEVSDGVFKPIPGSGAANTCHRCGKDHEVHAHVELASGERCVVGTGCMNSATLEKEAKAHASDAKKLRELQAKRAALQRKHELTEKVHVEVQNLKPPAPTIETAADGTKWILVGDARAKVQFRSEAETQKTAELTWRQNRIRELGAALDRHALKSEIEDVDTKLGKLLKKQQGALSKALYIGPKGGKWADPEHTIPWKGEHAQQGPDEPAKTVIRPHKALGFQGNGEWHFDVHEHEDGHHVELRPKEGGRAIRMPKASLRHFVNDMHGVVDEPETDDPHIGPVIRGEAELLGKGHEGLAFRVGNQVVKVGTTVPYQPDNGGHRTPDEAAQQTVAEAHAAGHLRAMGVPHVPPMRGVRHGEKGFLIRPHVEIPKKLEKKHLEQVAAALEAMHRHDWALNDQIQVGLDEKGDAVLFDVGHAAPASLEHRRRDQERLADLFRQHGETYSPPADLEDLGGVHPEQVLEDLTAEKRARSMRKFRPDADRWRRKARGAFARLRRSAKETFYDLPDVLAEELQAIDTREAKTLQWFEGLGEGAHKADGRE